MTNQLEIYSVNCEACGTEVYNVDLHVIKLAGLEDRMFTVCKECLEKTAIENYRDAASIFKDVAKIASDSGGDPEERLKKILELLGE